jgi:protoheme IX farnesyltransferase
MSSSRTTSLMREGRLGANLGDWATLLRPRIAGMVAVTAFISALLACGPGGDLAAAFEVALWVTLSAGAGSVLNQVIERDTDGLMARTADRPLVTGRIATRDAILFGGALFVVSTAGLALRFSLLAALLAAATLVLYIAIYTPLKRVSTFNTVPGAVAGAAPPAIAWAAVTGSLDGWGVWLAAILFVWQFPHFMAIAWMYREEYRGAGIQMLAGVEGGEEIAGRHAIQQALLLLPLVLLPGMQGIAGPIFSYGALLAGVIYAGFALRFARHQSQSSARGLLLVSLVYLPVVYSLALFDPIVQLAIRN